MRISDWSSDVCSSDLAIEDALANRQKLLPKLEARALPRARAEAFRVAPSVFVDNNASNRFTVVEVNAQDRPALLNQLAYALFQSKVTVHSAHVEIGRASRRGRVCQYGWISVGAVPLKKKKNNEN